jgi:hypothetical protein
VPIPPLAEGQERSPPELLLRRIERSIGGLELPLAKQFVDLRLRIGQSTFTLRLFLCALLFLEVLPHDALGFLAQLCERRGDERMRRLKTGKACDCYLWPARGRLASRGVHGRAGTFVLERLCP